MLISDIKEMEKIVQGNEELHWDGWNVVHITQSEFSQYENAAIFNRGTGKWHHREVYELDGIGWDIPDVVIQNEK